MQGLQTRPTYRVGGPSLPSTFFCQETDSKKVDRRRREQRREPESRVASVKLRAYAREKVEGLLSTFFTELFPALLARKS